MAFSHIDNSGKIQMVNISPKEVTLRTAVAQGTIIMHKDTILKLQKKNLKKGDPIACARIAGIMAAKKTSDFIPLCHPLLINDIRVECTILEDRVDITATVVCGGKTGVEMEALFAVSVAALTIYDMCKAVDKSMIIRDICLKSKKKEQLS